MRRVWGAVGAVVSVAGLVAGCSSGSSPDAGTTCGTTRTAAGVPVVIEVAKGSVTCRDARAVEDAYVAAIRGGQVKGNGGGAPVTVHGWTCQGYPTPEVLRTGHASECHKGTTEIMAVLQPPRNVPTTAGMGLAPGG